MYSSFRAGKSAQEDDCNVADALPHLLPLILAVTAVQER
jgi:hypothetical protein